MTSKMGVKTEIDKTQMTVTGAFKKKINHLLYSKRYTASGGGFDAACS
jgi:hypothetical protein